MTCVTSAEAAPVAVEQPIIKPELLEYLAEMFPDQVPAPEATEREIWMAVGAVRVCRHLALLYEQQNENILNRKVT